MKQFVLFMVLLGCKPKKKERLMITRWILKYVFNVNETGRNTEQHDVTFAVGVDSIKDCQKQLANFWPEGNGLHVDAYVKVLQVGEYGIHIVPEDDIHQTTVEGMKLFCVNLGTYDKNLFEELHKKILVVARTAGEATKIAKQDPFLTGSSPIGKGKPHVDNVFDADDVMNVADHIPGYRVVITRHPGRVESISNITVLGSAKVAELHVLQLEE